MADNKQNYTVVIGIELGACFSGYAYSFNDDYEDNPLKVDGHIWPINNGQFHSQKVPTTILFDPGKKFHSFGYEAEEKYVALQLAGEHENWFYFQRFIDRSRILVENTVIKAENGKEMRALDVCSSAIHYLHDHVINEQKFKLKGLQDNRKCLVIVSQNENDNDAFYMAATEKVGIHWDVKIISKKTAFMNYTYQWMRCSGRNFRPGPKYLLLDASAQRVTLEVLAGKDQSNSTTLFKHTCPGFGSEELNSIIMNYFKDLVGSDEIHNFNKCLDEQLHLAREVEFRKRKCIKQKAKPFLLKILKSKYQKMYEIILKSQRLQTSRKCIDVQEDYIQLNTDFISGLSTDSATNLAREVYEVLEKNNMHQLSDIIMVGGYSESPFLQKAIQRRFANSNMYTFQDPGMVELIGTVIFGHCGGKLDTKAHISPAAIKDYLSTSSKETPEKVRNLRLMLVGPGGVGKTLLCKHLMKETPLLEDSDQHHALEMYIQKYVVDLDTSKLENVPETEADITERRISMHLARHRSMSDICDSDKTDQAVLNDQTTEGVNEHRNDHNVKPAGESRTRQYSAGERMAYLSMLVFGGTSSISFTKHIFLSSDAIYLILYNIAECTESKDSFPNLLEWVRSIGTFSQKHEKKHHKISTPPIILVGTHKDQITGTESEVMDKIEKLQDRMCDDEDLQAIKDHVYGFFEVNCTDPEDCGLKDLWEAILEVAPAQSQWEKELPLRWLLLEREMMKLKYSGEIVKTIDDVREIAFKIGVPVEQLRYFLRYLHYAGSILYFGDNNPDNKSSIIANTVILSPQWMVNAFQTILIENKQLQGQKRNRRLEFLWKMYRKTAILNMEFVDEVWKDHNYCFHRDIIIAFMERIALIAKPLSVNQASPNESFYFVPSMLPQKDPLVLPDELYHKYTVMTPTLCLVFRNRFIPQQILDQLMAAFIESYKLKKFDKQYCLQRGFAIFKMDGLWSLVVSIQRIIKLTLYKQSNSKKIPPGVGMKVRLFVEDSLKKINGLHQDKDLVFDYHLHCKVNFEEHHQTVPVGEIASKGTLACCDGDQKHFLMKRDMRSWFSEPTYQDTEKEDNDLPLDLSSKILDRQPTRREIGRIAECLGKEYQLFFVELGLNISDINQIEQELNHVSQATKYMHMFDKWTNQNPENATIREILKAMIRHDMDIVTLVNRNVFEN